LLLRESGQAIEQDVELEATIGRVPGGKIPHGDELVRFGEAITRGNDDADAARDALRRALGDEAFVEAAGIVAIFNGLVRNADFSGIPLDESTLLASVEFRAELGLNDFAGSANSDLSAVPIKGAPAASPIFERGNT